MNQEMFNRLASRVDQYALQFALLDAFDPFGDLTLECKDKLYKSQLELQYKLMQS